MVNIFVLSKNTKKAAKYHCDKHVVKLILESAQILSTAHRFLDGTMDIVEKEIIIKSGKRKGLPQKRKNKVYTHPNPLFESSLYKNTHINHPCGKWVRESSANYKWLYKLFKNLCIEYTHRYGKIHLCEEKLLKILKNIPKNIPNLDKTPFITAMPEYCKYDGDSDNELLTPIEAYRKYYICEKNSFCKWTKREVPYWYKLENLEKLTINKNLE